MGKLTDIQLRTWIRNGERFAGRSDGNGLYLCFPETYSAPFWRFRYKLSGKARVMLIGYYSGISLAKARETAKTLSARVALGYDVAGEKQERKAEDVRPRHIDEMLQKIIARNAPTVANGVLCWTRRIFNYGMLLNAV